MDDRDLNGFAVPASARDRKNPDDVFRCAPETGQRTVSGSGFDVLMSDEWGTGRCSN